MTSTAPIQYDAESEAYLQRFPELRPLIAIYGPQGPRLHYENFGKDQGMTWGLNAPAQTAPSAPVETAATAPLSALYGNDAAGWNAFMDAGRRSAEGMNQMPGVFSDYASIPTNDAAARALFTGQISTGNPAQPASMGQGGMSIAPQPVGSLSPSQQFNRILDMGQDAFALPVHEWLDQQGGSAAPDDFAFYVKGREQWGL